MIEFNVKRFIRIIVDVILVICGVVWVRALFTFANGTMDNSMESLDVARYQIEALVVLIVANVFMVILFKIRKWLKEKIDEEAEK